MGFTETVTKAEEALTRLCLWQDYGDEVSGGYGDGELGHVGPDCGQDCSLTVYRKTVGCCEHELKLVRVHSGPWASQTVTRGFDETV